MERFGNGSVAHPGWVEVPGFGPWLRTTTAKAHQVALVARGDFLPGTTGRACAEEACRDYTELLHRWRLLTELGTSPEGGDIPWTDFETHLIQRVVVCADLTDAARKGQKPHRDLVLVENEYTRACEALARYLGISAFRVRQCGGDRAAVVALGSEER